VVDQVRNRIENMKRHAKGRPASEKPVQDVTCVVNLVKTPTGSIVDQELDCAVTKRKDLLTRCIARDSESHYKKCGYFALYSYLRAYYCS